MTYTYSEMIKAFADDYAEDVINSDDEIVFETSYYEELRIDEILVCSHRAEEAEDDIYYYGFRVEDFEDEEFDTYEEATAFVDAYMEDCRQDNLWKQSMMGEI